MKSENSKRSQVTRHTSHVKRRKLLTLIGLTACGVLLVTWSASLAFAGNLDSPAVPSDDSGRMYTVEQLYDKVNDGTTPTKQSGGFNEPAAGPASTMHTLDDIEGKIAAGTTDAAVGDVLDSKTFITRTTGNGEAMATGTMPDKEGDNVSTGQAAAGGVNYLTAPTGFYDGDDTISATDAEVAALDADITAGNIKNAVEIFGVAGTYTGDWGLPKTGQETQDTAGDDADYADPAEEDVGYTRGEGSWAGWNADGGRFTDNGDGTITDNATGLEWVADPTAAGVGGTYLWAAAITACEGLTYATHSDWRLPNVKELMSIVDYGTSSPAIDTIFFTSQSGYYWSSTTYADFTGIAWYVSFSNGLVGYNVKGNAYYVRPVRGGQ